jgi:hypothetical protein
MVIEGVIDWNGFEDCIFDEIFDFGWFVFKFCPQMTQI